MSAEIESPMNLGLAKQAQKQRMEDQALKPNDKMPFGKYMDQTFNEVGKFDCSYLDWFLTLESVNLSKELEKMIIEANYKHNKYKKVRYKTKNLLNEIWEGNDTLNNDTFEHDLPF